MMTIEGASAAFVLDRYPHRATKTLLEEIVILFFCIFEFVNELLFNIREDSAILLFDLVGFKRFFRFASHLHRFEIPCP